MFKSNFFYTISKMKKIKELYQTLLNKYGKQGWWPLLELHCSNAGANPTKTGSIKGYHPGNYSYPENERQKYEICLGAILTQNTSWPNVEKALLNLNGIKAIDPEVINEMDVDLLKELIRPAGYYNQKAKKVKIFTDFFIKLEGKTPTREQLLELWGVGKETADSILLYAYKVPIFVVDAYTRRIFNYDKKKEYDKIREEFEGILPKDYKLYQEYHALIVEHAKNSK
jgi:endonuclease-3 related protein